MFYTILWLVVWLLMDKTTFTFGTGGAFWSLIVAIIADIFVIGVWPNRARWFGRV
jgi:hypothetical protein